MSLSVIVLWGLHVCTKKMECCSCLCLWPFQFIPHLGTYYTELCVSVCECWKRFQVPLTKKLLLTRAQSGGKRERIESVTVTDELPVSATDTERVKPTFYSFVSSPPQGENGNSQHWTDAVNTTLQKTGWEGCSLRQSGTDGGRSGRSAEYVRFHLPWVTRGTLTALLPSILSQNCLPHRRLRRIVSPLIHSPSFPLNAAPFLAFPLLPLLTLCLKQSLTPSGLPCCSIWLSHTSTRTCTPIRARAHSLKCTVFVCLLLSVCSN